MTDGSIQHEVNLLADSARRFLEREFPLDELRRPGIRYEDVPFTAYAARTAKMGWQALAVPESHGGAGTGSEAVGALLLEMGRALMPSPFLGNLFGTWAISAAGTEQQKDALLPGVAAGEVRLAFAAGTPGPLIDEGHDMRTRLSGSDVLLSGTVEFVLEGRSADWFVVAVPEAGPSPARFHLVKARQSGVRLEPQPWRDMTRQMDRLVLTDARCSPMSDEAAASWPWIQDRILWALAADSAAGARSCLEMTLDYAKERCAFGRAIGSFQAIKHQLAELRGVVECAEALAGNAGETLSTRELARVEAAMAKVYACDAYEQVAFRSIQIFGGIGFTWEARNHLYFKRAHSNGVLFGGSHFHKERLLEELGYGCRQQQIGGMTAGQTPCERLRRPEAQT
ncbi:MAG: acyl-CoA dehydrogenase family protein [Burkholderiaceae bacterium]